MKQCTFVSVWDGSIEIESPAMFDPDTGIVSDVQMANFPDDVLGGLAILDEELVVVDGRAYTLVDNDDGTWTDVRNFGVTFSRCGYASIQATSAEEALRIANRELKYDDVSWDDDWHPTDVQLEE